MKVLKTREDLLKISKEYSLGFVATMGALHKGHADLIKKSQEDNDQTIVSIFVNPTQFNNKNDFETYPNVLEDDFKFCKEMAVDYVFTPSVDAVYKEEESIKLVEEVISEKFEGKHRPGHFSGVLMVVLKLLNLIGPDHAYFGEKDYQQYLLIKRMAENYFLKTKIIGVETVRDEFGLALSSRNLNLTPEGLDKARKIAGLFLSSKSKKEFLDKAQKFNLKLEYYGEDWNRSLMAHYIDGVRLIDNRAKENKEVKV